MEQPRARNVVPTKFDPPLPPEFLLAKYGARILDPNSTQWVGGKEKFRPTAYVSSRLLVADDRTDVDDIDAVIREAAGRFGWEIDEDAGADDARIRQQRGHERAIRKITFKMPKDVTKQPPDCWKVLQQARTTENRRLRGVGLDHVMFASPGFIGAPFNDNNPRDVVVTPFATGVGGTVSGKWDVPEGNGGTTLTAQLPNIFAGRAYINFHTVQFGGGEIRGQIVTPEPAGITLFAIGLGVLAVKPLRRKLKQVA